MSSPARKPSPSDVSDEEGFVAPYLILLRLDAPQRRHSLCAVLNGLRDVAKSGAPQRWLRAGVLEAMVPCWRVLLRAFAGRKGQPTAAILDSRTLRSTPESGARAGDDGAKRTKGSKVHLAVDTLGHLLALHVTPATEGDRAQVGRRAAGQEAAGQSVEAAFVDQGYTGAEPAAAAQAHGIALEGAGRPRPSAASRSGPGLGVERSFAWATRFRRRVRACEPLPKTLARPPRRRLRLPRAAKARKPPRPRP